MTSPKDKPISVRLDAATLEQVRLAAELDGRTVGEWARVTLARAARDEIDAAGRTDLEHARARLQPR